MKKAVMRENGLSLEALVVLLVLICVPVTLTAEVVGPQVASERETFRVVQVAEGLMNPWAAAFLPDGRVLVTERSGRLRIIENGVVREITGLPEIAVAGQGGLLDIALHPDYEDTVWIYLSHAGRSRSGLGTRITRGRLRGDRLVDVETIFTMRRDSNARQHFGSRLAFMPDGTLLFTIGDRGSRDRAQDLGDHAGSTLRINDDGSVPRDNPFARRRGALPEIYTYGNRNAQGITVHPETGSVWQHEHGPRGGDEINIIEPGTNYGWPLITYGREYSGGSHRRHERAGLGAAGHPLDAVDCAIGHDLLYRLGVPGLAGNLFVGALVGQHLRRLEIRGEEVVHQEVLLLNTLGRIRDVRQGPDGLLYLLTDERNGGLYRLEPVR